VTTPRDDTGEPDLYEWTNRGMVCVTQDGIPNPYLPDEQLIRSSAFRNYRSRAEATIADLTASLNKAIGIGGDLHAENARLQAERTSLLSRLEAAEAAFAEEKDTSSVLMNIINDDTGPTFMGEPVLPRPQTAPNKKLRRFSFTSRGMIEDADGLWINVDDPALACAKPGEK